MGTNFKTARKMPVTAFPNAYTWYRLEDNSREVWVLINPFGVSVAQIDNEGGAWAVVKIPGRRILASSMDEAREQAEVDVVRRHTIIPHSSRY